MAPRSLRCTLPSNRHHVQHRNHPKHESTRPHRNGNQIRRPGPCFIDSEQAQHQIFRPVSMDERRMHSPLFRLAPMVLIPNVHISQPKFRSKRGQRIARSRSSHRSSKDVPLSIRPPTLPLRPQRRRSPDIRFITRSNLLLRVPGPYKKTSATISICANR